MHLKPKCYVHRYTLISARIVCSKQILHSTVHTISWIVHLQNHSHLIDVTLIIICVVHVAQLHTVQTPILRYHNVNIPSKEVFSFLFFFFLSIIIWPLMSSDKRVLIDFYRHTQTHLFSQITSHKHTSILISLCVFARARNPLIFPIHNFIFFVIRSNRDCN